MENEDTKIKEAYSSLKNAKQTFSEGINNLFKKKKKILDEYRSSLESKKIEMIKNNISNTFE